jgi:hypothetical protein
MAMSKKHWLDEPRNAKLLWRVFLTVLIVCVLIEIIVPPHPSFDIESLFGFHAWFGLLACVVMIVAAKGLSVLLRRPDTYYDERDD